MIALETLTDGGQQPLDVAHTVADWLGQAQQSLDIAIYDLKLEPDTQAVVVGAIEAASKRGVAVRLAYNADFRAPIPVPPPPKARPEDIEALSVPTKPIPGIPDLMHHKFVVRDKASVWTGSTNWTDESWSREENVIVTLDSAELATSYTLAFEELWQKQDVMQSGFVEPRQTVIDGDKVRAWFCPGFGDELAHRIAKACGAAKQRIRICSPVLTSGPILGTLCQIASEGKVDLAGCVDQTQIEEVLYQWRTNGVSAWKIPMLQTVLSKAPFSGKRSTPYTPTSVHDYMHAKITVTDDTVFCGSFNLSRSGEKNAENMVEIQDAKIADELAAFVDAVRAKYPKADASGTGTAPTEGQSSDGEPRQG
ncbi:MAG TPA: phospholipase D-like domain-containing protein [Gaiellaceae bacterium]|nr:phospholipase D-like domain-containing protein [Gaiellaceae bacterium]